MVMGLLTGCGSTTENAAPADQAQTAEVKEESTPQAAGTDEAPAAEGGEDYSTPLPSDYSGTLTMWGWDDPYFQAVTQGFNELYPNVTFEYTPMANGDTLQKYQTALASGTELPDVAWAIIDSRAKVYELDMWEDLSAAPYNFDINEVMEFTRPSLVNSKGMVCGIEQCICPAGLGYRKDLAKEYLGTDDPKELEAMFPTWEAFIAKGKEVYEKSGGTVYMFQGLGDAEQFIREQEGKSWIEGNTIKMTDALQRSIELAAELRDNNCCDQLEAWSNAWYASFGESNHIFVGCATWSIASPIAANDPSGESEGHWGLMNTPEGNVSWGGTCMGITKTCQDKRLAWEFVKYACLSTEGAKASGSIGYFTSAIKPYEEDPELKNFTSPWFGDQNLGEMFIDEIAPNVTRRPMNLDDNAIHETLSLVTTAMTNDPSMTAEAAMEMLKEELEMRLPDYTIE